MVKQKKILGKTTKTQRGFECVEFVDRNSVACSIQQSSLATEDALWLGCNDANSRVLITGQGWQPFPLPKENCIANTRMHLTRDMVEALVSHLQKWLKTTKL